MEREASVSDRSEFERKVFLERKCWRKEGGNP